jgi:competence ComEA-like helix-hairpin-helix protein
VALTAGAQQPATGSEQSKQVFHKICGNCHAPETVTASRRATTQWEETFLKMIDLGAKGSDDEFTIAFDYLVENYGRVNVNRAPANEIGKVMGLPAKDAKAIVEYRKANGAFKEFDDVAKVPQIDLEKLKLAKEAMAF